MVASQVHSDIRDDVVWVKLAKRESDIEGPNLFGNSSGTVGELIDVVNVMDMDYECRDVVHEKDGAYCSFKEDFNERLYQGVLECVKERATKNLFPMRYVERIEKRLKHCLADKDKPLQVRFLTPPQGGEQEAMTIKEQLVEIVEIMTKSKKVPRKRMTIHLDLLFDTSLIYEQGCMRMNAKFSSPPVSHVKTSSKNSRASRNSKESALTGGSAGTKSKKSTSGASKTSHKSKESSKDSKAKPTIRPFHIPSKVLPPKHPKTVTGPEWYCFRIDPAVPRVAIDPVTNCIPSWKASKPDETGLIECKPLPSPGQYNDPKSFLSHIHACPFDKKEMEKVLYQSFPAFTVTAGFTTSDALLPYLETAVAKFAAVGIYVPPLQTLSPNNPQGTWFSYLGLKSKNNCLTNYCTVIIQCLKNPKMKLMSDSIISAVLVNCYDGYEALYMLAKLGGHPRLQDSAVQELPPMQTRDMTLITYQQK